MNTKGILLFGAVIILVILFGVLIVGENYSFLISTPLILIALYIIVDQISKRRRRQPRLNLLPGTWYETVVLPYARPFLRRQQKMFALSLGFILLALNLYAPAGPTVIQRLLATLIIVLGAVPIWLWISNRDRGIPFMPFFSIIYAVHYALPIFLLNEYSRLLLSGNIVADSCIVKSLIFSFSGLGLIFIGYYGLHQKALVNVVPKFKMQWKNYGKVNSFGGLLGIIGVLVYYIDRQFIFPVAVHQIVSRLGDLTVVSIVILFALHLKGHFRPFGAVFLWGFLVPTRVLLGVGAGVTFQGAEVCLMLIITYATLKHQIPWKAIAIVGVAFMLVLPIKTQFRMMTWGGGEMANLSQYEKAALYLKLAGENIKGETLPYSDTIQISTARLDCLMLFSEVVEKTPSSIPFLKGATYYPLLFTPIPRFLYPAKPINLSGQLFGHRYGFLSPFDFTTACNLPQLIELYINFGTIGVLLGSFFIGTIYRVIMHLFIHRKMGLGALISGFYISNRLMDIETDTGIITGVLFFIVFMVFVHILMKIFEGSADSNR